tara:strand:+ start:235 stop:627 length:393 start_codon:yes stop_codon:yes gene_type:complete
MKEKVSKKQLRSFGILIGFGFPLIFGWLVPYLSGHEFRQWTLLIGITGLTLGIISPSLLHYPYKGWMAIGHILGWLNSRLIFGIVFLFFVQPIAYAMRLFGYDPLKKNRKGKETYREKREKNNTDLTRIF